MSIIRLSDEFSSDLAAKFHKIKPFYKSELDEFLKKSSEIINLYENISKLLEKDYFVVVKNIDFLRDKNLFYHFSSLFGSVYSGIDYTGVKIDCPYTGCVTNYLMWHTDDAILGNKQHKLTTLSVLEEDPLKLPKNNILNVDDLVFYLEMTDDKFLEELLSRKVPMASKGVHYFDGYKEDLSIYQTLLYLENGDINIRFDLYRIKYFYSQKNEKQSTDERKFIYKFITLADKLKKSFYLEKNDFLILNNRKTLHDRGECSVELNLDGSLNTREIFVGFIVHEPDK